MPDRTTLAIVINTKLMLLPHLVGGRELQIVHESSLRPSGMISSCATFDKAIINDGTRGNEGDNASTAFARLDEAVAGQGLVPGRAASSAAGWKTRRGRAIENIIILAVRLAVQPRALNTVPAAETSR